MVRNWLRRGSAAGSPVGEPGLAARDLAERHLLLVPTTVTPADVARLLTARGATGDLAATGEVSLGRSSSLAGPYELSMEQAVDAAVPLPWTLAYALQTPIEREGAPQPGTDDRDGFAFAFPSGLPWREEGRGLHLMVSLARRLGGAVRTSGSHELIVPDPERAVDHNVYAPYWLEPEVLAAFVARVVPGARVAPEARGGAPAARPVETAGLTTAELAALYAAADAADRQALAADPTVDAYAVVGDLGEDGAVEVLAHAAEDGDPALAGQDWPPGVAVVYEVRWASHDPADRERRTPGDELLAARSRVAPVVRAVTQAVVEATSGVVTDEDGFWVDRYAL